MPPVNLMTATSFNTSVCNMITSLTCKLFMKSQGKLKIDRKNNGINPRFKTKTLSFY